MEGAEKDMSLPHLMDLLLESNIKIAHLQRLVEEKTDENVELTNLTHRLKGALLCARCRVVWNDPRLEEKVVCSPCHLILDAYSNDGRVHSGAGR